MALTTAKRSWDVERDGKRYHVEMEDEYFFGRRVLRVNGEVVYAGRTILSDHSGTYQFDLGGRPAFLKIRTNGLKYFYDLVTEPAAEAVRLVDPKDLVQRPPSLARAVYQVIFGIGLAAALIILTDGRLYREPLVALAGTPVQAVVTRGITGARDTHRIEYQFGVGGRTYRYTGFVSSERFEAARRTGLVDVRYLAVLPDVNAFAPQLSDLGTDALLLAIVALGGGLVALDGVEEILRYVVWRRLSVSGADGVGHVTGVRTLRSRYGLAVGYVVEYSYEAGLAGALRGYSGAFGLGATIRYPVGAPVRVRYDPERPRDSILLTSN